MELDKAIKILKELRENKYYELANCWDYGEESKQAIDTVLNELEKYQMQLDLDYVDKNFIPKERVENKLKEFEGLKEIDLQAYEEQIKPLKELLNKGSNKNGKRNLETS